MTSRRSKIAVIGAGNVGATCAFVLAQMKLGDIVMLDIFEGFAKGKALDMSQDAQVLNYDGNITGTADYADIAGADVVVVTSGFPRQPGRLMKTPARRLRRIVSKSGPAGDLRDPSGYETATSGVTTGREGFRNR